ncbi:fructose 2,6-bisphosphatase [Philodulcilactobacillus myokoensis]|uniref:Fructose 2,6-bisphosphatase n=1 Tax=Philodulcilactobacillus myokoensis TaxID=2929573 RepID=A0A9W6B2J7_9LACO|nr:histidine phosphatase family protein [Philodulcilactobacillus myokoensis]GLB47448.1 fructose 2,6-bisphosphatase [Philodulcilactobacillus myokoensis]
MTTFYFIRHGETKANIMKLKQGTINSKMTYLTDHGKQQVRNLKNHFKISFADRLFVSPLHRTHQTAEILNHDAKLPVQDDQRLLEISYGDWDGQNNVDLEQKYPKYFDSHVHDVLPTYAKVAHGETFESIMKRIKQFMNDIAKHYPDQKIVVVTHGFTVKAACMAALDLKDHFMVIQEPDNASVTKIMLDHDQFYIPYYNRTF